MLKTKVSLASMIALAGAAMAGIANAGISAPTPQRGQHRTTSNTRLGRSLISPSSTYRGNSAPKYLHSMICSPQKEIDAWNKKIEQKKHDKIILRAARLARQRDAWNNRKLAV